MARALWTNEPFPMAAPRATSPGCRSVADALKELDTLARQRKTTLRAASGTLSQGEGDSIRKAVLSIVFKAMGCPPSSTKRVPCSGCTTKASTMPCVMRLHGKTRPGTRVARPHVSSHLHDAILAAKPSWRATPSSWATSWKPSSPSRATSPRTISSPISARPSAAMARCRSFLLVLDELQQYIADSADRAMRVQEVIESLSKNFDGRV
jgi:hypothetical protein